MACATPFTLKLSSNGVKNNCPPVCVDKFQNGFSGPFCDSGPKIADGITTKTLILPETQDGINTLLIKLVSKPLYIHRHHHQVKRQLLTQSFYYLIG